MKTTRMLIWFTQLGISVVSPLVIFLLGSIWLRDHFQWGSWVVVLGILLGIYSAVSGFRQILTAMRREAEKEDRKESEPPVSFNDHS